ncbi:hypothetical protein SUGI_1517850 [Cryptomeria japonica]|uniref:Uncharacterized protein n=1 Tax=Cryptomeria japonica TaxID=3369 RepID=A0AAD3NSZ2_CRYJA|nr:hypothetical protein SUGI_1450130 [Cryptomeria japonica]GLJ59329.1 hypothetical protein SUGI_1503220 [Cryptomeria japonica]GLJ59655.1 hypothetical protein SUGI_1517850 [Cryptomeria japonica]
MLRIESGPGWVGGIGEKDLLGGRPRTYSVFEAGWNRRLGSGPSLAGSSPYGVYLSVTWEWGVANKTYLKAHWITELLGK